MNYIFKTYFHDPSVSILCRLLVAVCLTAVSGHSPTLGFLTETLQTNRCPPPLLHQFVCTKALEPAVRIYFFSIHQSAERFSNSDLCEPDLQMDVTLSSTFELVYFIFLFSKRLRGKQKISNVVNFGCSSVKTITCRVQSEAIISEHHQH